MVRSTMHVSASPSVMKWARETAGVSVEAVAKRLGTSPDAVQGWELGAKRPTLNTLNQLASFYRRPLAAFFLPEPPREPPMPTDFRVLPDERRRPLSKDTHLAIRRARRVQSLATELMKMRITSPKPIAPIGGVTPTQDPELVAAQERDRLGISIREQLSWRNGYEAFGKWREALEGLNIVVLQEKMPVEEVRGFSLLNDSLPAIVVSTSDSIRARAFSLFHEYAHLVLGTSGICIPSEAWHHDAEGQTTEKFCNHFAGAFLVPAHALREDEDGRLITGQPEVDDTCVDRIAGRFKVSRQVVLRRMLITGVISSQQYSRKLEEWLSRVTGRAPSFGVPPPRRCILENGRLFVSLALEARERGLINYSDLSDYLSINLKHLDRVEALLHR